MGVAVKLVRAYKIARVQKIARSHFRTKGQNSKKIKLHKESSARNVLLLEQIILHGDSLHGYNF